MPDVIIRHGKNFVPSRDCAGRGLFSEITAGLDNQMNKFVVRIPFSVTSSSNLLRPFFCHRDAHRTAARP